VYCNDDLANSQIEATYTSSPLHMTNLSCLVTRAPSHEEALPSATGKQSPTKSTNNHLTNPQTISVLQRACKSQCKCKPSINAIVHELANHKNRKLFTTTFPFAVTRSLSSYHSFSALRATRRYGRRSSLRRGRVPRSRQRVHHLHQFSRSVYHVHVVQIWLQQHSIFVEAL
jgi:hypothetical protein